MVNNTLEAIHLYITVIFICDTLFSACVIQEVFLLHKKDERYTEKVKIWSIRPFLKIWQILPPI